MATKAAAAQEATSEPSAKTRLAGRLGEAQHAAETTQPNVTTDGNAPRVACKSQQDAEGISSASPDKTQDLAPDAGGSEAATIKPVVGAARAPQENNLRSMPMPEVRPPVRDTVTLARLAPDAPFVYAGLDDKTFHSTLSGFVQQTQVQYAECGLTLYYRVLPGLQDAERRFREHEGEPDYRLEGCKGIEEYVKKLDLTPARVRKWRQRDKERRFAREIKLLAGEPAICAECGRGKGHEPSCSSYVKPETEALTVLEAKFVDASVKQHAALQDFYAGRTDAEGALKTFIATLPDHNKLEEYVERGSNAVETDKKVDEQQGYICEFEERISYQNEEIAKLKTENENLRERIEAINAVPQNLRDETITATLAAEPDTAQGGEFLERYLKNVAHRVLPPEMALQVLNVSVTIGGRDHRIMPDDFLERQDKDGLPTLCKCTGIAEFMQRRKVREWSGNKWGKERVLFSEHEPEYRVITEQRAQLLAPAAFPATSPATHQEGL